MNKLLILCGMVLLGTTSTPQEENSNEFLSSNEPQAVHFSIDNEELIKEHWISNDFIINTETEPEILHISSIPYAELEEEFDLGFETSEYLPDDFDPNLAYASLKELPYYKALEEMELEVDTKRFLPEGFDAYANPTNFMDISFIEKEEEVDLGFDTNGFLPERFDAYKKELDLNLIPFIEDEDLRYGYDTSILAL
ncbi:MAG: hypothetical protein HKP53_09300 [Eudoraea sp.]|nr:hypothetical protein [Eudoraea sp.]